MKPIQIISQDLFDKVRSRFSNLEMGDETGAVTIDPAEARFFDFDFIREGVDLGRVSISLNDLGSLKVYYSQGITEGQDAIGKKLWYDFLKEMRFFAMRRLLRFDTRDIAKTNLDKNDFQHLAATQGPKEEEMTNIAEGRWNGRSSTKTSRAVKGATEVIIRHHNPVQETFPGARSQRKNIKAIFIQNKDGERFKYPFIHPAGAFAMAQHVDHGGVPHDPAGKAIIKMSEEIAQLAEFQKTVKGATLHDDALGITERAIGRLHELKAKIEALGKRPHYESWISEFTETDDGLNAELDAITLEDYKSKFTQKNFQEELSQFFPLLHRIMGESNKVNLEDYVNNIDSEAQAENNIQENLPIGHLDKEFAEWAEDVASTAFNADKLAQALQELPQPLTLSDEMAADEVVRFFSEYGIESPDLKANIEDQARINPSADPIKDVIYPWAQKPENQEKFPGLSELLQTLVGEPAAEPAAAPPVEPAPAQPVAEDRDTKAMIGEVARIVKSFYNKDNPNVGPFRSEEGVAIDVEKEISEKFGEEAGRKARMLAEKFMAKLTQEWAMRHKGEKVMGEKPDEGNAFGAAANAANKGEKFKVGDRTFIKSEDDEALEAMSRHAKGYEKYGKKGMDALRRAAQDGAGEEKMDKIRKEFNRYDEEVDLIRTLAGLVK